MEDLLSDIGTFFANVFALLILGSFFFFSSSDNSKKEDEVIKYKMKQKNKDI